MLIVPTLLKWRALFAPLRAAFGYFRPKPRPFDMEIWDTAADDPEMVRRAAAILEAYLGKSSLVAIGDRRRSAPHKRLLALVHPDRSGSAYLARKVQQARDTLLASREWLKKPRPGTGQRSARHHPSIRSYDDGYR